jgi:hypothetical protein
LKIVSLEIVNMATFTTIADGPIEVGFTSVGGMILSSAFWPVYTVTHVTISSGTITFTISGTFGAEVSSGSVFIASGFSLSGSSYSPNGTYTVTSGGSGSSSVSCTTADSDIDADATSGAIVNAVVPASTDSIVCAYANTLGGDNLAPVSYTFASLTISGGGSLVIGNAVAPTTINAAQVTGANTTGYVSLNIGSDLSTYVLKSSVVAASFVVTGHSNYPGGDAGTYPTTATSQAAQLATDQAAVLAAAGYIDSTQTVLGQQGTLDMTLYTLKSGVVAAAYTVTGHNNYSGGSAGTYPTSATTAAAQLVTDQAAVTAQAASILNSATILSVAGTFDEAARNTDPGQANVWTGTSYKILNVSKNGSKVASSITNLSAGNVKDGVTVGDVVGTFTGSGSGVDYPFMDIMLIP